MRTLIQAFWRRDSSQDGPPVCYLVDLQKLGPQLPGVLLASSLEWMWASGREMDRGRYNDPSLPNQRPLTVLTSANGADLVRDFRERNEDGYGRWLNIYGVRRGSADDLLNASTRAAEIQFLRDANGPIQIIIVQVGDATHEWVFTARKPSKPVADLLARWSTLPGIVPGTGLKPHRWHGRLRMALRLP